MYFSVLALFGSSARAAGRSAAPSATNKLRLAQSANGAKIVLIFKRYRSFMRTGAAPLQISGRKAIMLTNLRRNNGNAVISAPHEGTLTA
jgi:hypothetical protein